jgi:signal transduction histidine kinase
MGLIIALTIVITFTGALLEFWGYVPHFQISGLLAEPLYNNIYYVLIYFTILTISLFLSSYLANSIARQLYNREKMLSIAYKELEQAEKSKTRYVMSVVHDLKTPIAAASTYLNLLLEGTLGRLLPEQVKPLERCKARLSNAINIINDILHISQLKLEEQMEKPTDVPLCKVFSDISEEMKVLFKSKKINYSYTCEKQGELYIRADYNLLRLALSNLVSNAYKYTEDNGIVEISVDDKKDFISITVADNGIGIPQVEIDKIFNDFYRSSISKKKEIEGTGLGLSLVKKIVEKYGGTITVQSPSYLKSDDQRIGTQFTIIFPKS